MRLNNENSRIETVLNSFREEVTDFFSGFSKATADTFAWLAVVVLNCATIPSFLAVKTGLSDRMPSLDLTVLLWLGLLLYFVRSAILKDMLIVVTIGVGFAIQAILLGLIFFV
jgi:hypothetical protein